MNNEWNILHKKKHRVYRKGETSWYNKLLQMGAQKARRTRITGLKFWSFLTPALNLVSGEGQTLLILDFYFQIQKCLQNVVVNEQGDHDIKIYS